MRAPVNHHARENDDTPLNFAIVDIVEKRRRNTITPPSPIQPLCLNNNATTVFLLTYHVYWT